MRKLVKATVFWWDEDKFKEGVFETKERAEFFVQMWLNIYPANENTEVVINDTYVD